MNEIEQLSARVGSLEGELTKIQENTLSDNPVIPPDVLTVLNNAIMQWFGTNGSNAAYGRAYVAASQSINDVTTVKVLLDSLSFVVNATWNSGTNDFTIKNAGKYLCTAVVSYQTVTSGKVYKVSIEKNGGDVQATILNAGGTGQQSVICTSILTLAIGDTIGMNTFHNSGLAENLLGGDIWNYFCFNKIS